MVAGPDSKRNGNRHPLVVVQWVLQIVPVRVFFRLLWLLMKTNWRDRGPSHPPGKYEGPDQTCVGGRRLEYSMSPECWRRRRRKAGESLREGNAAFHQFFSCHSATRFVPCFLTMFLCHSDDYFCVCVCVLFFYCVLVKCWRICCFFMFFTYDWCFYFEDIEGLVFLFLLHMRYLFFTMFLFKCTYLLSFPRTAFILFSKYLVMNLNVIEQRVFFLFRRFLSLTLPYIVLFKGGRQFFFFLCYLCLFFFGQKVSICVFFSALL